MLWSFKKKSNETPLKVLDEKEIQNRLYGEYKGPEPRSKKASTQTQTKTKKSYPAAAKHEKIPIPRSVKSTVTPGYTFSPESTNQSQTSLLTVRTSNVSAAGTTVASFKSHHVFSQIFKIFTWKYTSMAAAAFLIIVLIYQFPCRAWQLWYWNPDSRLSKQSSRYTESVGDHPQDPIPLSHLIIWGSRHRWSRKLHRCRYSPCLLGWLASDPGFRWRSCNSL